ncbi:hypothetical protein [Halodesulfovibrio aestuarii]|uniref:Uncharacterized protein n=1 Tax=Halodesulfovibrio aestuarii TaxID=126333 RepID=A0A8G2C9L9_9BACT|nr:hypothetical protein [Halodesulfovibrio aestuarii]SHJ11968.1 hypothetical protein SAMN05660830_01699 [Halodesulfovibrio aestuarii]
MSDEARRVFKMETILGLIAGKGGTDVSDLLCYLTQRELSAEEEGVVAPMSKGWLYSMEPRFMQCCYEEGEPFDAWTKKQASKLGSNVSVEPIPAADMASISIVLDKLAGAKATVAEQAAAIEGLQANVAEFEPFKAQAADLEKKVEDLTGKLEAAQTDLAKAKKELKTFEGKVAINETEVESSVKDIVSRAVKDALASLPAGAAVAAADGAEAAPEEAPAESAGSSVPDDFGFGASGNDDSGFGF